MIKYVRLSILLFGIGSLPSVLATAHYGSISGRISITKKLTRKRVTLEYEQRGLAVPIGTDAVREADDELQRIAVYLEGPGLNRGEPELAKMVQKDRKFEPEIVVVPAGSAVSFPNFDPIFHNVFSLSKSTSFDLGYYPQGQTRSVKFEKPGIVQVFCHLHSNMSAAIVVTPSGFNTRPQKDGTFLLSSVPPGKYQIVLWHKAAGLIRRAIDVKEFGTEEVLFEIPYEEIAKSK